MSLAPVRCYTCGRVIEPAYRRMCNLMHNGATQKEALDTLVPLDGMRNMCCRMLLLSTHLDSMPAMEAVSTSTYAFRSTAPDLAEKPRVYTAR